MSDDLATAEAAPPDVSTPVEQRTCVACRYCTHETIGQADYLWCSEPSSTRDDGGRVSCHLQRHAKSSDVMKQCGVDAILFQPKGTP